MKQFKFEVIKIDNDGKIWTHEVNIKAESKFEAESKLDEIYPSIEFKHKFIE